MPKYHYHISDETDGEYRIVKSFEVEAPNEEKAEELAQEELRDFIENLNVQLE